MTDKGVNQSPGDNFKGAILNHNQQTNDERTMYHGTNRKSYCETEQKTAALY